MKGKADSKEKRREGTLVHYVTSCTSKSHSLVRESISEEHK